MRNRSARGLAPAGLRTALLTLLVVLAAGLVADAFAQTPYVPYFGKNKIRYNNFEWHIYRPTTSRSITTRRSSRISNASRAMPRVPISRSART